MCTTMYTKHAQYYIQIPCFVSLEEKRGATYSQINVFRRHCLLKLHLVFGRLPGIIILRVPGVDRLRRMPNIVTRAPEGCVRPRTIRGRVARGADVTRSFGK